MTEHVHAGIANTVRSHTLRRLLACLKVQHPADPVSAALVPEEFDLHAVWVALLFDSANLHHARVQQLRLGLGSVECLTIESRKPTRQKKDTLQPSPAETEEGQKRKTTKATYNHSINGTKPAIVRLNATNVMRRSAGNGLAQAAKLNFKLRADRFLVVCPAKKIRTAPIVNARKHSCRTPKKAHDAALDALGFRRRLPPALSSSSSGSSPKISFNSASLE